MAARINHFPAERATEEPMDFLELLPPGQAVTVQDILEADDMTDDYKEKVVITIIKSRLALDAFKTWWTTKKAGNVENFLCHLKPTLRRAAQLYLDEENLSGLEELLEIDDAAHAAFLSWKAAKCRENLVTEEDFLALLNPALRRIAEYVLNKNDMEGLNEVMEKPGAITARPIFQKWMAQKQNKPKTSTTSNASASGSSQTRPPPRGSPVKTLERQLSSTTISSVNSDPEPGLEYSEWAVLPSNSGGHLVGKEGKNCIEIERKTGCKVEVQKGNDSRPTRYRVGGRNQQCIEKGQQEVIAHLAKIQKTEEMVHPSLIPGLQSISETALIEFQRNFRVCISKTENSLGTASITMKAWDHLELLAAKHELGRIIPMNMYQTAPPMHFGGIHQAPRNMEYNFSPIYQRPPNQFTGPPTTKGPNHQQFQYGHNKPKSQPKVNVKPEQEKKDNRKGADISQYPDCMNILVLGETGVGKSTFINGLINYFNYTSMEDALNFGVKILIKSSFTLTDANFDPVEINSSPTLGDEQDSQANEVLGDGQSATQDPKSYRFSFGQGENKKFVRIIDTPGIGDTRGIDQDKKNFQNILHFISQFSEIHAVCILIKPNTARLTIAFRFCIDELLVHLHRSASANLLFCFTNTRATLYKPGDTLPTLREHLKKLKDKQDIQIPLNGQTLFSFDNESFRFLCALKENFPFTESEKRDFGTSWKNSVDETLRLFDRITQLPVHYVHDTLSLNNARNVILSLTRPLAEIARMLMINKKLIEDKMAEVKRRAAAGLSLQGKLTVDQMVMNAEEVSKPQTVCTAEKCVEHQRFSSSSEVMQTVYKQVCHKDCHLTGVPVENCPNTMLQHCAAMSGDTCRICGCSWQTHMHIRYRLVSKMTKVEDPTVRASIANNDDSMKTARIFMAAEQKKIDEMTKESEKIASYCAEFAAFLSKHSILPYNDSYESYINHLIKEEKDKVSNGGSNEFLRQMQNYKSEYDEQVRVLNASMQSNVVSVRSTDEIDSMVEELRNMKNCAQVLEAVKKLEMLSARQNPPKEMTIPMETSWLSASYRTVVKAGKKAYKHMTGQQKTTHFS